jgi:vacuolar iron transporter family protein
MSISRPAERSGSTKLGRAVRSVSSKTGAERARTAEPRQTGNWLRDVILGGQDGLVNVLGISLGLSAAGANSSIILAAGLAATITESISMGAVAYTSTLAERDRYLAEQEQERAEIRQDPEMERDEIRQIYRQKGFSGELLERVVQTISSNHDAWVATMMSEELHLEPVDTQVVLRTSIVVAIAAVIGSLIPLLPMILIPAPLAIPVTVLICALVLFGVGYYQARTYVGDWRKTGLQFVAIGLGAAFLGYLADSLFHVNAS